MSERGAVRFGTTTIEYAVIRSARRRKTLQLTLDPAVGVLVAAPLGTPGDTVHAFVARRAGWIVRRLERGHAAAPGRVYVSGESLPWLGRQVLLTVKTTTRKRPRVHFAHWQFTLEEPSGLAGTARREVLGRAVERWYRTEAGRWIDTRVTRWSGTAGYRPTRVLIRNQRRRWGSCSEDGTLRFNWRIMLAPPEVIDYVIVHELAHLRVRHHSATFWAEVGRIMPDFALQRRRLREIGASLNL